MNLKHLKDKDLLSQTKQLIQNERQLLTQILHHLREVERRKLFSDLGYQSLFEYAVKELKYSEGQAGRRIQAMRLIKELPQVEKKIKTGSLSLSNISQAQSYFREAKKMEPEKRIASTEKLKVLESLENKSAREGQKILIKMQPQVALPKERERILTESHTEMRFVITEELGSKLEELRSLLGAKGSSMSFAELVDYMTEISIEALKVKKFGKKRVRPCWDQSTGGPFLTPTSELEQVKDDCDVLGEVPNGFGKVQNSYGHSLGNVREAFGHVEKAPGNVQKTFGHVEKPLDKDRKAPGKERYISKVIQHQIWKRDQGKCCKCGSQKNLNIDHIKPVALGGGSEPKNLRLLCFHCNQRQAMKVFGVDHIRRQQSSKSESIPRI